MKRVGPAMVAVLGIVFGWLIWEFFQTITVHAELWDPNGLYYYVVAFFLSGAIASLPSPRWFWLAAVGVFVGQGLYLAPHLVASDFWLLGPAFTAFFSGISLCGGGCVFLVARLLRKDKGESK